jgi:hypothetical protein
MSWTITWPDSVVAAGLDPNLKRLCEVYATACMTALTLHRVGGNPVSIMPQSRECISGHYVWYSLLPDEFPVGQFYPGTIYPSAQELKEPLTVREVEAIDLPGPVGAVTEVLIDGVALAADKYRVENGRYLVRMDGESWPTDSGDNFVVTYFNSHPVDEMGAHAAGVMANEWLKLFTRSKDKCRLPSNATNVARQGITIEVATGMFPEGVTGLPEIDAYLMLWNPYGVRVLPRVYSPDLPKNRQVWHA